MSMMYVRNLVDLHLKYYTDQHNVDEDMTTIVRQGGLWAYGDWDGIARRDMFVDPTTAYDYVASNAKIRTPTHIYIIILIYVRAS